MNETNTRVRREVFRAAMETGHASIAMWAFTKGVRVEATDLYEAASRGHLDLMERVLFMFVPSYGLAALDEIGLHAASSGCMELVQWVLDTFRNAIPAPALWEKPSAAYLAPFTALRSAARGNHTHVMTWLVTHAGSPIPDTPVAVQALVEDAAKGGIEALQWIHNTIRHPMVFGADAMRNAASRGHFDAIRWMHAEFNVELTYEVIDCAAEYGQIEVLKWCEQQVLQQAFSEDELDESEAMFVAAREGHLGVLQWLHDRRRTFVAIDWNQGLYEVAAAHGHMRVLEWLHDMRCPRGTSADAITGAVRSGSIDVIVWLRNRGFKWNADACTSAAEHGRLDILEWLRAGAVDGEQVPQEVDSDEDLDDDADAFPDDDPNYIPTADRPCPIDVTAVVEEAASNGRLDIIAWARGQGIFQVSWQTWRQAARSGHLHVLEYLLNEQLTWPTDDPWTASDGKGKDRLVKAAADMDHREVAVWLALNLP